MRSYLVYQTLNIIFYVLLQRDKANDRYSFNNKLKVKFTQVKLKVEMLRIPYSYKIYFLSKSIDQKINILKTSI
jgi:hypothetical protein